MFENSNIFLFRVKWLECSYYKYCNPKFVEIENFPLLFTNVKCKKKLYENGKAQTNPSKIHL